MYRCISVCSLCLQLEGSNNEKYIYAIIIAVASLILPGVLILRLTVGLTSPGKLVNAWTWKQQRTSWWLAETWKARIRSIMGRIGWRKRLGKLFEETVNDRERGMMDWKNENKIIWQKHCRTRTGMECTCCLVEMQNLH